MVENDMRQSIVAWLDDHGCEAAHECWVHGGYCDVIGFKFAPRLGRPIPKLLQNVAVELKMSNVRQVIRQASQNKRGANASYAAMPTERCKKMRDSTRQKFIANGVGLLSVHGEQVNIEIPALWVNDGREQCRKKTWWRWHLRNERKKKSLLPLLAWAVKCGAG